MPGQNVTAGCTCGCAGECACTPAEFVRLRYFYGQRLGAVDLNDAQAYAIGKQRFHNFRLHGVGVLCGLRAEVLEQSQGSTTTGQVSTVLRVTRGAALDACGREVLVPVDQCIDVAAWFQVNRNRPDVKEWLAREETPRRLWVGLRYRECPSDPAPAPRDPCGCDAGGYEFARVREAFELVLFTDVEKCHGDGFPTSAELGFALDQLAWSPTASAVDRLSLNSAVTRLLLAECPRPSADAWICLVSFEVTLVGDEPRITAISNVDHLIPGRRVLLSTGAMQKALVELLALAAGEGSLGLGPTFGELSYDASKTELRLGINLYPSDSKKPEELTPLAAKTFTPMSSMYVTLQEFSAVSGWSLVPTNGNVYPNLENLKNPAFDVKLLVSNGEDRRFRLVIDQPISTPIVDEKMRPLRPLRFVRHFRIKYISDVATLTTPLWEGA